MRDPWNLKVSTRSRGPHTYEGVLRHGSEMLYQCGHDHAHRDDHGADEAQTKTALACIIERVRATRDEELAERLRVEARRAAEVLAAMQPNGRGRRLVDERLQAALESLERCLAELTRLIGDRSVYGASSVLVLAAA